MFCCHFLNNPVQFTLLFGCPHFESRSTDRHYDSRCLWSATALSCYILNNSSHGYRDKSEQPPPPWPGAVQPSGHLTCKWQIVKCAMREWGGFTIGGGSCGRWPSMVLLFVSWLQLESAALNSACAICVFLGLDVSSVISRTGKVQ